MREKEEVGESMRRAVLGHRSTYYEADKPCV
jgi:hypothetical protein